MSDDDDIYVDHDKIETAAVNLRGHKKTFDEILGQLESDLAPMVSTWSGEARDMYMIKKQSWDKAAADLTMLLGFIAQITEDAHVGYANAVSDLSAMWT